ncbi:hypothetical protein BANRA_01102 [Escherichia coli]|nr:hypothetical protein BANRA_01102 [Escherichia coli]
MLGSKHKLFSFFAFFALSLLSRATSPSKTTRLLIVNSGIFLAIKSKMAEQLIFIFPNGFNIFYSSVSYQLFEKSKPSLSSK